MSKAETIEKIKRNKIVPVIRAASAAEAEKTIENVLLAGLKILEITMTTPDALRLIEKFSSQSKGEILIGAGTVFDTETAEKCAAAGAKFIVSPIFAPEIIVFCERAEIAAICGAFTPTEIFAAWQAGADAVKVFPVHAAGGADYIKSVKAVFPSVRLMPTGGVSLDNAAKYFSAGAEAVGIGSGLDLLNAAAVAEFLNVFA